jgi:hypothetical protein
MVDHAEIERNLWPYYILRALSQKLLWQMALDKIQYAF